MPHSVNAFLVGPHAPIFGCRPFFRSFEEQLVGQKDAWRESGNFGLEFHRKLVFLWLMETIDLKLATIQHQDYPFGWLRGYHSTTQVERILEAQ